MKHKNNIMTNKIIYTGENKWEVMKFIEDNLSENKYLISIKISKFTNAIFIQFNDREEVYIEIGNTLRKDTEKGFDIEFS